MAERDVKVAVSAVVDGDIEIEVTPDGQIEMSFNEYPVKFTAEVWDMMVRVVEQLRKLRQEEAAHD